MPSTQLLAELLNKCLLEEYKNERLNWKHLHVLTCKIHLYAEFICVIFVLFNKTGPHSGYPGARAGWPDIHRDQSASASKALRLKAWFLSTPGSILNQHTNSIPWLLGFPVLQMKERKDSHFSAGPAWWRYCSSPGLHNIAMAGHLISSP